MPHTKLRTYALFLTALLALAPAATAASYTEAYTTTAGPATWAMSTTANCSGAPPCPALTGTFTIASPGVGGVVFSSPTPFTGALLSATDDTPLHVPILACFGAPVAYPASFIAVDMSMKDFGKTGCTIACGSLSYTSTTAQTDLTVYVLTSMNDLTSGVTCEGTSGLVTADLS